MKSMEMREALLVRYHVENLRMLKWGSLVLRYDTLMIRQVEMDMASLRDNHRYRSYLVHNVELR